MKIIYIKFEMQTEFVTAEELEPILNLKETWTNFRILREL